jgi:OPA family glycerol-3-phosphate transporter-like MFS transporter
MRLSYVRELNEYPTGLRRIWLLSMVVLAILIGSYEAQIAPVVPLLLKDLHMSLATYGSLSAIALVAGALASIIGGRFTDNYGRVRLLAPFLLVTGLLCFLMVTVHSPAQLLMVRILLAIVDGIAIAGTAPLIRDFTPRVGRAQGFGFWTWGPVGANFLAAAIAGATLQMFSNNWRSQFVIMGILSIVVTIVILFNIADLSPELRDRIRQTHRHEVVVTDPNRPARALTLLTRPNIWAHIIGIAFWLMLYVTLLIYGPTMISQSFKVDAATASSIMAMFWVLNLATLIIVGWISDRTQLRKPIALLGTVAALAVSSYLVHLVHTANPSHTTIMITGMLLGGTLGWAYVPWMANFSQDAEDVDPRLQGTAWGIYGFVGKVMAIVALLVIPRVVAAYGWGTWLIVANICMAVFIPATLLFHGPWLRRQVPAGIPAAPAEQPVAPVP